MSTTATVANTGTETPDRSLRLVGYIRVSTDNQAENGMGLAIQERSIKSWVKANGHKLARIERDEGLSGSGGLDRRAGLHQALQLIQEGKAEGLVVYKLDRLARQLTVQEATLAQVWKHAGLVYSCDLGVVQQDDPDDPMRTAMRQMVGVFAQLERGMISARMRAGRAEKVARGGYAFGAPAFGFQAEDRELVAKSDEAFTSRRIIQLHDEGKSLREIIAVLDTEGRKPKRSTKWHPTTVGNVIRRNA